MLFPCILPSLTPPIQRFGSIAHQFRVRIKCSGAGTDWTSGERNANLRVSLIGIFAGSVDRRAGSEVASVVQPCGARARYRKVRLWEFPLRCNLVVTRKYIRGVLPWLLLGPLTGPLAEGVVRNWRAGEVSLAWLYGLALWLTTFDLYSLGGRLILVAAKFGLG